MGESENCEGALILQSLIAKCGDTFTAQMWTDIFKAIISRLEKPITYTFLSSNLNALIALSLVYSWKCFSEEENEILFNRILQTIAVFQNVQYSPKVLITAFTQMLMMYEVPFINRRFVQILDLTISLLEFLSQNKTSYFAKEEDSDEIEYSNSLILLKNDMKSMD